MSTPRPITLLQPARIAFGAGGAAPAVLEFSRGVHRRAVVISTAALTAAAETVAQTLATAGIPTEVILEPPAEPTVASCEALRRRTRAARPDVVYALGGGSVLDVAKLAAALHDRDEPVAQFFGSGLVTARRTALACLPTTAGTGSEVSPNALLLDEAAQAKKAVISPALVPDIAIVDPELMRSLPPALTATTGIDALAHCLEAYANLSAHPVVDLHALEGVRLIATHLPRAVADGHDLAARSAVALGSLYGGLCLGPVNTNGVHALAYPLGGEHHLPHGLSIALMLPHVVAFNCSALPERHAALARALGAPDLGDDRRTAAQLPERLRALLAACRVPLGLERHNIPLARLPQLAEAGLLVTRLLKNNPRPVSRDDAIAIYQAAYRA
ncbi:iron-containing alcohol dehydrogenase [Oleiharenicola sp. Vm1]|uniref:iron-containing alcohol dehydrogenase n=1 Tax=Oleiharenicola sp. Vm1 TaxID=3398393 RepID=UPI0039F494CD